jgi:hypothetical protein
LLFQISYKSNIKFHWHLPIKWTQNLMILPYIHSHFLVLHHHLWHIFSNL